jgi:hypothetical protein
MPRSSLLGQGVQSLLLLLKCGRHHALTTGLRSLLLKWGQHRPLTTGLRLRLLVVLLVLQLTYHTCRGARIERQRKKRVDGRAS